jgi:hypothetical protein
MRIGFASIYSWRPHVEHLYYLADLVERAGHETEFLTCDGDLPSCYTRELRDIRPDWQECLMCRAGGVRSYARSNVSSIGAFSPSDIEPPTDAATWAFSSASTLGRFESNEDYSSPAFINLAERLRPSVEKAFLAATRWMETRKIEALVLFNGRMDATRAVFEAAQRKGIPVVSLERTWFGDGLQLLPQENCLGLQSVHRLVAEWAEKPLTHRQAKRAASYIASRFLRRNKNEWRAYNVNAAVQPWPVENASRRILLIPGSRNEHWGHPDWNSSWNHPLDAYDAIIDRLNLSPKDLLLRCHPNWGENIGKIDGSRPENVYTQWAEKHGITVIPSKSTVSTLGLIEQADAIVIAGGSAVLEAGALGKQIIGIGPSTSQQAGIRDEVTSPDQLKRLILWRDLPQAEIDERRSTVHRKTLRFAYTMTHRVPQYVEQVKCENPTRYVYRGGGNPDRLLDLLHTRSLVPDDVTHADNESEESPTVEHIRQKEWENLFLPPQSLAGYRRLRRRFPYTGVDFIRSRMRRGDR